MQDAGEALISLARVIVGDDGGVTGRRVRIELKAHVEAVWVAVSAGEADLVVGARVEVRAGGFGHVGRLGERRGRGRQWRYGVRVLAEG